MMLNETLVDGAGDVINGLAEHRPSELSMIIIDVIITTSPSPLFRNPNLVFHQSVKAKGSRPSESRGSLITQSSDEDHHVDDGGCPSPSCSCCRRGNGPFDAFPSVPLSPFCFSIFLSPPPDLLSHLFLSFFSHVKHHRSPYRPFITIACCVIVDDTAVPKRCGSPFNSLGRD